MTTNSAQRVTVATRIRPACFGGTSRRKFPTSLFCLAAQGATYRAGYASAWARRQTTSRLGTVNACFAASFNLITLVSFVARPASCGGRYPRARDRYDVPSARCALHPRRIRALIVAVGIPVSSDHAAIVLT